MKRLLRIRNLLVLAGLLVISSLATASSVDLDVLRAPDGELLWAWNATMSGDANHVAFNSRSLDLIPEGVSNPYNPYFEDVFVYDLEGDTIQVASRAYDGDFPNGEVGLAALSDDGGRAVFTSFANNLVPGDTNGKRDLFLRDFQSNTIRRVNVSSLGVEANDHVSGNFSISGDGRYVVFSTPASNLVQDDTNSPNSSGATTNDVFVHDIASGATERVSLTEYGGQTDFDSQGSSISYNGRYVAYYTTGGDVDGVYVRDRLASSTMFVAGGGSFYPQISRDGRFVSYLYQTSGINTPADIYVKDLGTGGVTLETVTVDGLPINAYATDMSISDDGRYLVFHSLASNLVEEDTNGFLDVFIRDRVLDETVRVTQGYDGQEANHNSRVFWGAISSSGDKTILSSSASNLVPGVGGARLYLAQNPLFATNNAPVLAEIGNKTIGEGELLEFGLTAVDPDGDTLTFGAENLPAGATFDPATATFAWTPSYDQSGNYVDVEFYVMDDGEPMEVDAELITITVGNVNRPPEFIAVGSLEVQEGETLSFTVEASDPDGDAIVYSVLDLPAGAVFDPNTATFNWVPTLAQSGVYEVTFVATDDGIPVLSGALEVIITVGDVPTPSELTDNLVDDIVTEELPNNIENSYLANLKKVNQFIEDGKIQPAINQLNAFIQKVTTDMANGDIDGGLGQYYIDLANQIITLLQ